MAPSSPSRRLRWAEIVWICAVVAYSGVRIVLAHRYLSDYGIDTRVFGAIEVVSSVPYAVGTSRFVQALLRRRYRAARWWGLLGASGFLAPDLYVLSVGRSVPHHVYVVLGTVLSVSALTTVLGLRDQVLAGRRSRNAASAATDAADAADAADGSGAAGPV